MLRNVSLPLPQMPEIIPETMFHVPLPAHDRLDVGLGDRAYPILVGGGLVASVGAAIRQLPRGATYQRAEIISDSDVGPLYADMVVASLSQHGFRVGAPIIIPAGEASKNIHQYAELAEILLARKVDRHVLVIALGGGVVGDLVGFVAATTLRGLSFVQIPTSLLAQVDSSVGGKTGINSKQGKNLIGAFHQPCLVLADTDVLNSLPVREVRAGYAEIVKYGLIDDPDFFDWLSVHGAAVISGDETARRHAITVSCRHKADIVARDEKETGDRALLNLGHSFGHALEAEAGYDGRLLHGEAVAMGMVMAHDLSVRLGFCPAEDLARIKAHLAAVGLPVVLDPKWASGDVDRYLHHMMGDKKNQHGTLTLILSRGIGKAFIAKNAALEPVRQLWADYLRGAGGGMQ